MNTRDLQYFIELVKLKKLLTSRAGIFGFPTHDYAIGATARTGVSNHARESGSHPSGRYDYA